MDHYLLVLRAVQFLKGESRHRLLSEFSQLKQRYWSQYLLVREILCSEQRKHDGYGLEGIHQESKASQGDDDFIVL